MVEQDEADPRPSHVRFHVEEAKLAAGSNVSINSVGDKREADGCAAPLRDRGGGASGRAVE